MADGKFAEMIGPTTAGTLVLFLAIFIIAALVMTGVYTVNKGQLAALQDDAAFLQGMLSSARCSCLPIVQPVGVSGAQATGTAASTQATVSAV